MGYVDMHSHILPGLDDGAKNMDEAMQMLEIAYAEGITHIVATPHYKSGRFPADAEAEYKRLQQVQYMADERDISIFLYAGKEIFYHSELEEKFQSGRLSTMNGTKYVLIEFSPLENYIYMRNAMEDVLGLGYTPILAHVERYQCLCKDIKGVEELKALGCDIQVNASSVAGECGWRIKHFVHKLLKAGLVDYIGTDAHNTSGRKPAMQKCAAILYKKYEKNYVNALLYENAMNRLLLIKEPQNNKKKIGE